MTRVVIVIEGMPWPDGRVILPGAIKSTRDFVPVTLSLNDENIIGRASQFHRNRETGEISMEIEIDRELEANISYSIENTRIFLSPVEMEDGEVSSGTLKAISIQEE